MVRDRLHSVELVVPNRLSYSSASKYAECGEKWRLEYGRGITSGSWFATVGGKAVHSITELNDRVRLGIEGITVPTFKEEFLKLLAAEQAEGVKHKASGTKLVELGWTGGPNKKDVEWWLEYGPKMVLAWETWRNEHPELEILILEDGTPAIELEFRIEIGEETVLGYVDRIFIDKTTGNIIIVDLKTGKTPAGQLQLGDYGVGMLEQYGVQADYGCYWVAWWKKGEAAVTEVRDVAQLDEQGEPILYKSGERKGQPRTKKETVEISPATPGEMASKLTDPVDLRFYSKEFMVARYEMARDGIMAGVFMPHVTSMCKNGCGVRKWCRAAGGENGVLVPVRELFIREKEVVIAEEELTD